MGTKPAAILAIMILGAIYAIAGTTGSVQATQQRMVDNSIGAMMMNENTTTSAAMTGETGQSYSSHDSKKASV